MFYSINRQSGFSLLEILISAIVLAVGMLGIAALQLNSIRYNNSAQLRSIAVAQVSNMVDRMLANTAGVEAGSYNSVSGTPSLPSCTTCTPGQIAQRDTYMWNSSNGLLLPSGQGTITRTGNQFTLVIRWDNERTGATGTGCSGNAQVDLTCLTVEVEL